MDKQDGQDEGGGSNVGQVKVEQTFEERLGRWGTDNRQPTSCLPADFQPAPFLRLTIEH